MLRLAAVAATVHAALAESGGPRCNPEQVRALLCASSSHFSSAPSHCRLCSAASAPAAHLSDIDARSNQLEASGAAALLQLQSGPPFVKAVLELPEELG